jgi:hypothetical protein
MASEVREILARLIERAARLGHVATGTTYFVVGVVALIAACDARSQPLGSQGALRYVFSGKAGRVVLLAIAAGFAADFLWQVVRSVTNADRAPAGLRGIADRVGWLISGAAHLGLAVSAINLGLELPDAPGEGQVRDATAAVMPYPFGQLALIVTASVFIMVGIQLLYRAFIGDVDRWLDLRSLHPMLRAAVLALGRFGLAARGIVFCAGGTILLIAAIERRPWRARALGGTLHEIGDTTFGPALLAIVALGFMAFGVVEILSASYRRIQCSSCERTGFLV